VSKGHHLSVSGLLGENLAVEFGDWDLLGFDVISWGFHVISWDFMGFHGISW